MKQYENDTLRYLFIKSTESHKPAFLGTGVSSTEQIVSSLANKGIPFFDETLVLFLKKRFVLIKTSKQMY